MSAISIHHYTIKYLPVLLKTLMLAFYLLKRERQGKNQATCEINVLIKLCEGEHIRFRSLFDINNFNNWLRDPYTEIIN